MVRAKRLLSHKGDANNVLPTAITYHSVPCGVYRDTPVYRFGPNYKYPLALPCSSHCSKRRIVQHQ